jgi:hypothetical protein
MEYVLHFKGFPEPITWESENQPLQTGDLFTLPALCDWAVPDCEEIQKSGQLIWRATIEHSILKNNEGDEIDVRLVPEGK